MFNVNTGSLPPSYQTVAAKNLNGQFGVPVCLLVLYKFLYKLKEDQLLLWQKWGQI